MTGIINLDDVALDQIRSPGGRFAAGFASLTDALGARKLGVSLAVVPPGKCAFPKHAHHTNEEMVFILEGAGTWHCGGDSRPVRAGDLVSAPPGDGTTAHQLENTSDAALRYLTFSTREGPEVVEYPDSGKFAVSSRAGGDTQVFGYIGRHDSALDYYDGEED